MKGGKEGRGGEGEERERVGEMAHTYRRMNGR